MQYFGTVAARAAGYALHHAASPAAMKVAAGASSQAQPTAPSGRCETRLASAADALGPGASSAHVPIR